MLVQNFKLIGPKKDLIKTLMFESVGEMLVLYNLLLS